MVDLRSYKGDIENADLPEDEQVGADYQPATAADEAFHLAEADEPEPDEESAYSDGPPAQIVEAAVKYGASEAEDYALLDPR